MRRCAWFLLPVVLHATAARAAQPTAPSNEAAAEALFTEGRTLIDGGRIEEGCRKLEASNALDAGTGTLIHLGDCYEKLGRTATAWARFREAAARAAREQRSDWEKIANARASELEPKLAKLRVDAPPGVTVSRDGQEIPAAALGSPLPLDPGETKLTAAQSGKKTWTTRVRVAPSSLATVVVPALENEEGAETHRETDSGSTLRILGFTAGGVGLVGIVVGTVTGLRASSLDGRSKELCPTDGVCSSDQAREDNDNARSAATISTIGFVAGGLLVATGVTLLVLAPSSSSTRASAAVRAAPAGILLEGAWW
jgi:hypothetical protein